MELVKESELPGPRSSQGRPLRGVQVVFVIHRVALAGARAPGQFEVVPLRRLLVKRGALNTSTVIVSMSLIGGAPLSVTRMVIVLVPGRLPASK